MKALHIVRRAAYLLASLLLLTGCSGGASLPSDTADAADTAAAPPLDLFGCVIVRSDLASEAVTAAAVALRDSLSSSLSAGVKITNDVDLMYGADSSSVVRLLVGDTLLAPEGSDVSYTSAALDAMGDDDHVIMTFADGTVVIAGLTDAAVKRAVSEFISGVSDGTVVLSAGTEAVFSYAYERPSSDYSSFTPILRFAAASDVHIKDYDSVECDRLAKLFEYAYAYADSQEYTGLDAVVFAGDVSDHGYSSELERFSSIVNSSLRDGTQFICEMGNHEFFGGSQSVFEAALGQNADQHNVINGFHFITVSPSDGSDYSPKYNWLTDALDEAAASDPEAPIFVFQHHHIKDTVYVSEEWYTTQLDDVFSNYPAIIDFSGHSHAPVNNPRSIWQDKYTTLGTGTLSYFEMNSGMTYGTIPPDAAEAAQFYIVEVDALNRVRILPFNILTGKFFTLQNSGDPDGQLIWYIPTPSDPDSFTYTSERGDLTSAPYFDSGTEIVASGVTANGTRVSFTFPQAHDDECVYSYTLTLTGETFSKDYKVFSGYYIEPLAGTVTISAAGIRSGQTYTVTVSAYDCWGHVCEQPLTTRYVTP